MKYIVTMGGTCEVLSVDLIEYLEEIGSLEYYYSSWYWSEGNDKEQLIKDLEDIATAYGMVPTVVDLTDRQRRELDG